MTTTRLAALLSCSTLAITATAIAAIPAYDSAAAGVYDAGWANGADNISDGFAPWILESDGTNGAAGHFIASASNTDLNWIGPRAWGLYANDAGTNSNAFQSATAARSFEGFGGGGNFAGLPLYAGQQFSIQMEHGSIQDSSPNGFVGVQLIRRFKGQLGSPSDQPAFQFGFRGGDSNYRLFDLSDSPADGSFLGTGRDTGVPFTNTGLRLDFVLTNDAGLGAYQLTVTRLATGQQDVFTGAVEGNLLLGFKLLNLNAEQNDAFFNRASVSLVPEPTTLALIGAGAVLALRRRT